MPRFLVALFALLLLPIPALAACTGTNLLANPDADTKVWLQTALAEQPHATGNFWRATRGNDVIHIIGTYHLDDPRHQATMDTLEPIIATATTLLVEAGPDEESALKSAIAKTPDLLFITSGPSLMEQMTKDEWATVAAAMKARGIPPFMAAKFQPWYLSMMLGIPPCAMAQMTAQNGLDHRIIDLATDLAIPVQALEPFDTVFTIFNSMTPDEQLGMIRSTLPLEGRISDFTVTMADSYFAEDSRRPWEYMRLITRSAPGYTPARADAEFAAMENALMIRRNQSWIPVLEATAARGPTFAAFGALHLSGQNGVLALLERAGFTVERLPL